MKKLLFMLILAALATASFGQIETKYRLDINEGDSLLLKYTYQNHIKGKLSISIHYKKEVFTLDTVLLKSNEVRNRILLSDSLNGNSIGDIYGSLYNTADTARLKAIMRETIIKERRGQ